MTPTGRHCPSCSKEIDHDDCVKDEEWGEYLCGECYREFHPKRFRCRYCGHDHDVAPVGCRQAHAADI